MAAFKTYMDPNTESAAIQYDDPNLQLRSRPNVLHGLNISQQVANTVNQAIEDMFSTATQQSRNGVPLVGGVYDDHTHPHHDVTVPQLTLAIIWVIALTLLLIRKFVTYSRKSKAGLPYNSHELNSLSPNGERTEEKTPDGSAVVQMDAPSKGDSDKSAVINDNVKTASVSAIKAQNGNGKPTPSTPSTTSLDDFLIGVVIIGAIMFYFFLCDYRKVWPDGQRTYDRDNFLFLVFLLFLVSGAFTIKPTQDKILNRDQTEEWKGWMQVMFVWYHYWKAAEWYNWIRVYIAAYVWMTGFGNFSFFWVRKDFSVWRVAKMLFRLNFLVILVCAAVSNEYMLYYICMMHTYWFLSVYAVMGVFKSWNADPRMMALKFVVYAIFNFVIFDIPGVCEVVFRPLWFIFQFHDGTYPPMHEWAFRGGLDHWACFVGMLCAYNYPHYEALMKILDNSEKDKTKAMKNLFIKFAMIVGALVALAVWYSVFMTMEKYEYNKYHPYTSAIPIISFILLRNMFSWQRKYYIDMFAWLGKITLETYLSQLHIYLQSNAKGIIDYIPGYTLLNFSLNTIIYLFLSYTLFNMTVRLSSYLFPKDYRTVIKNAVVAGLLIAGTTCVAYVFNVTKHL